MRELGAESGKVWNRIAAGGEIVVTRNGKPFALLLHTEPAAVEAALRAHRAARLGALLASLLPVLPPQYQLVAGAIGAVAGAVAAFKRDPASQDHVERP